MPRGELFLLHQVHDLRAETQQAQGIGHGRAGAAHAFGRLLLGKAVVLHQGFVALGLLNGVQILPLEVLDDSYLHRLSV